MVSILPGSFATASADQRSVSKHVHSIFAQGDHGVATGSTSQWEKKMHGMISTGGTTLLLMGLA
jgi:hypothetical protein